MKSIIAVSPSSTAPSFDTSSANLSRICPTSCSISSFVTSTLSFFTFNSLYFPNFTSGSVIIVIFTSKPSSSADTISSFGSTAGISFSVTIISPYLASIRSSIALLTISPVPYFFSKTFLGTFPCLNPSTLAFFDTFANALSFALLHSSPLTL